MAPLLFAPSSLPPATAASLQRSLLRLLEDDDEDIRLSAAQIVCDGLKLDAPVVQSKAVSLWWNWVSTHGATEKEWLWSTAMDVIPTSE